MCVCVFECAAGLSVVPRTTEIISNASKKDKVRLYLNRFKAQHISSPLIAEIPMQLFNLILNRMYKVSHSASFIIYQLERKDYLG